MKIESSNSQTVAFFELAAGETFKNPLGKGILMKLRALGITINAADIGGGNCYTIQSNQQVTRVHCCVKVEGHYED